MNAITDKDVAIISDDGRQVTLPCPNGVWVADFDPETLVASNWRLLEAEEIK